MAKTVESAARVEGEIMRKVHRYTEALLHVIERRPPEERAAPISNAEHLLAVQVAEAVTAYETGLRERRVPEQAPPQETIAPPKEATLMPQRRRRRGAAKRRRAPVRQMPPNNVPVAPTASTPPTPNGATVSPRARRGGGRTRQVAAS